MSLKKQAEAYAKGCMASFSPGDFPPATVHKMITYAFMAGAKSNQKPERTFPKGNMADAILSIITCLNELTGSRFKPVGASASLIRARLEDPDVTPEGICKMIRRQCAKWKGTDMEEYLRPSTLFRASKFENYYAAKDLPVEIPQNKKRRFGELNYDT